MSAPINPTRQQLEELDALLQRMLSLPLNQQESLLPPPPPPPPPMAQMMSPPPMPVMSPRPTPPAPPPRRRAEPPSGDNAWNVPLPVGGSPPIANGWPVGIEALNVSATSTVTPKQAAPPARLRVTSVPSPQEMNAPREAPAPAQRLRIEPPPMTIPIPAMRPQSPAPPEAPLPFYLWPLGVMDRTMGNALAAFGPPGRWLGQGGGKVFFGWCGLLMLTAAAVWGVMDYMGWSW